VTERERLCPFWLVWNPTRPWPPKYRHPTEASARTEAQRLATANPGEEFVVLASVATVLVRSPVEWRECGDVPF